MTEFIMKFAPDCLSDLPCRWICILFCKPEKKSFWTTMCHCVLVTFLYEETHTSECAAFHVNVSTRKTTTLNIHCPIFEDHETFDQLEVHRSSLFCRNSYRKWRSGGCPKERLRLRCDNWSDEEGSSENITHFQAPNHNKRSIFKG